MCFTKFEFHPISLVLDINLNCTFLEHSKILEKIIEALYNTFLVNLEIIEKNFECQTRIDIQTFYSFSTVNLIQEKKTAIKFLRVPHLIVFRKYSNENCFFSIVYYLPKKSVNNKSFLFKINQSSVFTSRLEFKVFQKLQLHEYCLIIVKFLKFFSKQLRKSDSSYKNKVINQICRHLKYQTFANLFNLLNFQLGSNCINPHLVFPILMEHGTNFNLFDSSVE